MSNHQPSLETQLRRIRNGSHSDIMFIVAPFVGLLIHSIWIGETLSFFTSPFLSVFNTALAGLAISKYVQCLAYDLVAHPARSRAANMVGFTTLFSFIPSLILAVNIHSSAEPAELATYIQFSIFVLTISIYFSYLRFITNLDSNYMLPTKSEIGKGENDFPQQKLQAESNE